MKRTVELFRAGTPSARQPIKFYGFRGVGSPGRRDAATATWHSGGTSFTTINNWRDGEPLIQIKHPRKKPSAKRYRKQVAAFTQWCDYIRARFGLAFNDPKVEAIVKRLMPKYQHLTLKGQQ